MKLLILSDSHGQPEPMRIAVRRERPDAVIHLGDHAADAFELAQEFSTLPVSYVRGNCDFSFPPCAEVYLRNLEGVRVFAAHGHRYGVKQGLLRFCFAAQEQGAGLALFGHTHSPLCEQHQGIWLLNPGACSGRVPTYGVAVLSAGTVQCRIREVFEEEYR